MLKNFVRENTKLILGFLILIILIPCILLIPSKYGCIPQNIGFQLLSYSGSIIGGFFTLYGVWWTIIDQNKKRKEELAIHYKPILMFELDTNITNNDSQGIFTIKVNNSGRGEALVNKDSLSVKIKNLEIYSNNGEFSCDIISPNFPLKICIPYKPIDDYIDSEICISLTYKDPFGLHTYKTEAYFKIYIYYMSILTHGEQGYNIIEL